MNYMKEASAWRAAIGLLGWVASYNTRLTVFAALLSMYVL
jgi:hypothetical protein